ncbi:hypothetical protein ACLB2K_076940 [Fragaria x ananassa]
MFHNLMQVDGKDYQACNTKSPIVFYDTGSDAINLKKPGNYYYIGGTNFEPEWYAMTLKEPGHCQAGQKLHVKLDICNNKRWFFRILESRSHHLVDLFAAAAAPELVEWKSKVFCVSESRLHYAMGMRKLNAKPKRCRT